MNVDEPSAEEQPSEEAEAAPETPAEEDDEQAEITDPDDIDALLDSMGDESTQKEITDPVAIEEVLESITAEADTSTDDNNESPNKAKIENLTEEYVAPLLAADFSDIHSDDSNAEANSLTEEADDDLDIDALIAEVEAAEQPETPENLDVGDELEGGEPGAFDEETLAKLLNDSETENAVELTPDFSDQNVLADLLTDNGDDADSTVSEATEIEDIQELDNLEFDELLANIEEESNVASAAVDYHQDTDLDSPISLDDFDDPNSGIITPSDIADNEENFVSVDSLLSESQDVETSDELYNEANIDVGLNDYPEFTEGVNQVDVDDDENGMAAKLDLAKVYVEIGDQDNAQVILQEIISQGSPQQQLEAQELLDKL
jgi:pilus assembly protein FimV